MANLLGVPGTVIWTVPNLRSCECRFSNVQWAGRDASGSLLR